MYLIDHLCEGHDGRQYASGGGKHPSAREPTLLAQDFSRVDRVTWDLEMEICADLLALLLKKERTGELLFFDWKTGKNIAVGAIVDVIVGN